MIAPDLVNVPSRHDPAHTASRVVAAVEKRGMSLFARIDHAAAARAVGLELWPTEVMLFGNPRAGTLLMQDVQTIGIDLPLKILVWEDERNQTWISYNDPAALAERHGATAASTQVVAAMTMALSGIADDAAGESAD